jgi:hypothetical protein
MSPWEVPMYWLWVICGVLGLGLTAFLVLLVAKIRAHIRQANGLSLADYVAVASAALNVVLLVIAVAALYVAITTYIDAKRSGEDQAKVLEASRKALVSVEQSVFKQGDTLEKSREALDSSSATAVAQQRLLAQSVSNSSQQLRLLQQQWARELEQPDIQAILVYPNEPSIILRNVSKVKPVRTALYQIVLFNVDKPVGNRLALVSTVATSVDFIPPEDRYLPTRLSLMPAAGDPAPVKGDRLFGYLSVSCADCKKHRAYWVLMKYEEDGWYCEAKGQDYPFWKLGPDNAEGYVSQFLKRPDLTPMPRTLE